MVSKAPQNTTADSCSSHCSASRYQRTLCVSGILLILASFIAGYFCGIGNDLESLSTRLDQEAFSDQISASLMPMQESEDEQEDEPSQEPALEHSVQEEQGIEDPGQRVCAERTYYAQLAGFGNKQSAYRFAQKLIKKKIPVIVNAVHSKTNRGKSITWYQVVTESYSTKEELVALVEQLKETEKLRDPQIVYC